MRYWIRQFFTRPSQHKLALGEVAITAFFSLLPLVIAAAVSNARADRGFDVTAVIARSLGQGQLFLYAYGLFGGIFWLSLIKWKRHSYAPQKLIGFLAIAITFIIAALIGDDPELSNIVNESFIYISGLVYVTFLIFQYFLLFYEEIDPPSAEESLRQGSNDLQSNYRNRHLGNE